jgi:hypothetical protein
VFEVDDDALVAGECTRLIWIADEARTVRLEGEEVDKQGSKEVCPDETKTYTLKVVRNDGSETRLKVEIEVFQPTPTVTHTPTQTATPTPTFTPTFTPTATHTPAFTPSPTLAPSPASTPTSMPTETPATQVTKTSEPPPKETPGVS